MSKPGRNLIFRRYMLRLVFRFAILVVVGIMYFIHHDYLTSIMTYKFFSYFSPLHILWAILMVSMAVHLIPKWKLSMGHRKLDSNTYTPPREGYDKLLLLEYVQKMNQRAWVVLLVWILFNAIFGILYCMHIIGAAELLMLSLFYYVCDDFCIVIFCPFQKYFMGNHCCISCRIFDWGYMMMYTPMLFIPSFFSWSLLFMALLIAVRWELTYSKYPERFWRGSNASIRCQNCSDKLCRIKKPLVNSIDKVTSAMPSPANKLSSGADELDSKFDTK